jgi:hypothetical protein
MNRWPGQSLSDLKKRRAFVLMPSLILRQPKPLDSLKRFVRSAIDRALMSSGRTNKRHMYRWQWMASLHRWWIQVSLAQQPKAHRTVRRLPLPLSGRQRGVMQTDDGSL